MIILLFGCSLGIFENQPCESDSQCQSLFGLGHSCSVEDGFCERFTPHQRCLNTLPEDLYENWDIHADRYIIGTLFDHVSDDPNLEAANLAMQEVQERGLEETNFALIHCNYQNDENEQIIDGLTKLEAVQESSRFLRDQIGVSAIIGPAGSEPSANAFNAVENTLFISPSATATSLSTIDGAEKSDENPGTFWRTVASDGIQANVLGHAIASLHAQNNVSIVYESSIYGQGFADILETKLQGEGVTTGRFPYAMSDQSNAKEQWDAAADQDLVDSVVFISSDVEDLKNFLRDILSDPISAGSYEGKRLYFADAAADSAFMETVSGLPNKSLLIFGTRPPTPSGSLFNSFKASYEAESGLDAETNVYAAYTYDATWMALYGYAWAHFQESEASGQTLARGLRKLSSGSEATIGINLSGWASVVSSFSNGTALNIQGTSGALDYDPVTEELNANFEIWQLDASYTCQQTIQLCSAALECNDETASCD